MAINGCMQHENSHGSPIHPHTSELAVL